MKQMIRTNFISLKNHAIDNGFTRELQFHKLKELRRISTLESLGFLQAFFRSNSC